jgi:hypothetical protein
LKTTSPAYADLERRLERLGLSGKEGEWADRYLMCDHLMDPLLASPRQRFEAVARFIRDLLSHRWVKTRRAREQANPKRIYYLSLEYLIGRTLNNNIMNLGADPLVQSAMKSEGWSLPELLDEEPDVGPGATADLAGSLLVSSIRWRRCSIRRSATACVTNMGFFARRFATATRSSSPTIG